MVASLYSSNDALISSFSNFGGLATVKFQRHVVTAPRGSGRRSMVTKRRCRGRREAPPASKCHRGWRQQGPAPRLRGWATTSVSAGAARLVPLWGCLTLTSHREFPESLTTAWREIETHAKPLDAHALAMAQQANFLVRSVNLQRLQKCKAD